jgi:hypothetical protein
MFNLHSMSCGRAPFPCSQGSGYAVLPLVGAAHHACRRVPTIPHAGLLQATTAVHSHQLTIKNITTKEVLLC